MHAAQNSKKNIAVFFGGRSPEHDVSVITGLQVLQALDTTRFTGFPVYVTTDGRWLVGDALRKREHYLTKIGTGTHEVTLDITAGKTGRLIPRHAGLFQRAKPVTFDVAIPCFHGINGEDGTMQGLFDFCGVAYAGMRAMACSILMDKAATKKFLHSLDIPTLPYATLKRPASGYLIARTNIADAMREKNIGFPCIIKPAHLGSSIGVAKATNEEELQACLPAVFEYDDTAIIEPFVPNLVEYNIATMMRDGIVHTSAIERPKTTDELLDFKQKYMSGGKTKSGTKNPQSASEGMLSLTREINPALPPETQDNMRRWVTRLFTALDGTGAPRTDFIGNRVTGEIWLNEVNPWPGSLAFFLWEAAPEPCLFMDLVTHLIDEALTRQARRVLPADPVPVGARLLPRR